ncbi:TPA: hypothetical protein R8G79_000943 [Citrobacter amalonaticus]|nr:hypothetical protein [Citrobacter amalonaticus]
MNQADKARLYDYKRWVNKSELGGIKLIAYNCPNCLEKLKTLPSPPSEIWDSFSNCPFCKALLFKVTKAEKVEIQLIKAIG